MEYFIIIYRTIVLYAIIVVIFRLMGKREIGELSILDLVVFIMFAEMAVISIEDPNTPMINSIISMIVLLLIQLFMAFTSLKSKKFRDLVDGKPSVLINKGSIDENELKKQRYNISDLLVQLREKDVKSVADVEFAILEPSGKLSVFPKDTNKKETGKSSIDDLQLPLIEDGKVQREHLQRINKTELWLRQTLRKKGYRDMKKISFCSFDSDGELFIDLIDEKE